MSAPPHTGPIGLGRSPRGRRSGIHAGTGDHPPEDRFTDLFDRHFAEIHGYVARRLGGDIADDVAAETFLTAFRTRDRFDAARGDHRALLYGIATNLIRRHRRHEARTFRALSRLSAQPVVTGHEDRVLGRVSAQDATGGLPAALAALSPGDRDVLLLVALADLTYEQVAAALGVSYGTVCSRLHRARRKVRAALAATADRNEEGPTRG